MSLAGDIESTYLDKGADGKFEVKGILKKEFGTIQFSRILSRHETVDLAAAFRNTFNATFLPERIV